MTTQRDIDAFIDDPDFDVFAEYVLGQQARADIICLIASGNPAEWERAHKWVRTLLEEWAAKMEKRDAEERRDAAVDAAIDRAQYRQCEREED